MENGCLMQCNRDIEAQPSFQCRCLLYVSSPVFSSSSLPMSISFLLGFAQASDPPRNLPLKPLALKNHCIFHFNHLLTHFLPISLGIFLHIHVLSLTGNPFSQETFNTRCHRKYKQYAYPPTQPCAHMEL